MMSYFVSAELSSFLGVNSAESIHRHEIEHKILSYAKDNNLYQNPMVIRTDETLETLMNGKQVFNGFSIIPYLKNHLIAFDDQETISEQGDQLESYFNEEETSEESNQEETPDESNQEDEENQEVTVRRVILRDPSGNEFIFENSNHDNVRIQRTFVMSNEEFQELANTITQAPHTNDKEEQPYEYSAFLVMFLCSLLTFSLWLSIFNNGLEKINR
jgi:hypothetical protein